MDTKETILSFNDDGTITGLWDEAIPLEELGELHVERASNVEFNNTTREWEVVWTGETRVAYSHPSRDNCLAWERAQVNEMVGTGTLPLAIFAK